MEFLEGICFNLIFLMKCWCCGFAWLRFIRCWGFGFVGRLGFWGFVEWLFELTLVTLCMDSFLCVCVCVWLCWKLTDLRVSLLTDCCSTTDWKYGAEKFVKELPDKVFVHCKVLWKVLMIAPLSSKQQIVVLWDYELDWINFSISKYMRRKWKWKRKIK